MIPYLPVKMLIKAVAVAGLAALAPAVLPFLLLSPGATPGQRVALYAGIVAVWLPLLVLAGALRWVSLGIWRPGFRRCLCDQPVRCYRHHSSPYEPNRPGVVAARLAAAESEDA